LSPTHPKVKVEEKRELLTDFCPLSALFAKVKSQALLTAVASVSKEKSAFHSSTCQVVIKDRLIDVQSNKEVLSIHSLVPPQVSLFEIDKRTFCPFGFFLAAAAASLSDLTGRRAGWLLLSSSSSSSKSGTRSSSSIVFIIFDIFDTSKSGLARKIDRLTVWQVISNREEEGGTG